MTLNAYLTSGLIVTTFILLVKTRIPPAALFLGALTAAITLKLAPMVFRF